MALWSLAATRVHLSNDDIYFDNIVLQDKTLLAAVTEIGRHYRTISTECSTECEKVECEKAGCIHEEITSENARAGIPNSRAGIKADAIISEHIIHRGTVPEGRPTKISWSFIVGGISYTRIILSSAVQHWLGHN